MPAIASICPVGRFTLLLAQSSGEARSDWYVTSGQVAKRGRRKSVRGEDVKVLSPLFCLS
jgi:hypothetical protein